MKFPIVIILFDTPFPATSITKRKSAVSLFLSSEIFPFLDFLPNVNYFRIKKLSFCMDEKSDHNVAYTVI